MLGTGCCSYVDTVRLTRHAVALGIKSILLLPPFYYKQIEDEGLLHYFSRVIEQVGEDDLEIYLYHFPKMTGLHFSSALLEKLLMRYPRNFVGMKDSGGDFNHMKSICKDFPGFKLFAGTEKYLLDVLKLGGAGCISATANVTVTKCMDVYNQWQSAEAETLQATLTAQRNIFEGLPFIGILKQYMAHLSGNPQWLHVRPPNGLVPEIELKRVVEQMANCP
jgi:4-hydroxy-tetrahydrodipicolinate synthase